MRKFIRRVVKCKYLFRALRYLLACIGQSCHSLLQLQLHKGIQKINMNLQIQKREEISKYQLPVRFLGEIHIVLSSLIITCSIGTIVNFYYNMTENETPEAQKLDMGFILYLFLTLLVSLMDICLSVLLICAAKKASLEKSLVWQRFTISLLISFSILTLAFGVLLSTPLVILGLIPSLIYKPFALWIVDGLIIDLRKYISDSFPLDPMTLLDSSGTTAGTEDNEIRKSTTVFIFNNKKSSPDIVENKSLLTKTTSQPHSTTNTSSSSSPIVVSLQQ